MGILISAPTLLTQAHDLSQFQSGEAVLDEWLQRRALKNQENGASRTYVIASENQVVGYYALATGSVLGSEAPGNIRRNMPDPIPVIVLGRLAIDRRWQGKGLGKALLKDAILRTLQAAEIAGIRAILVHALHEKAALFYSNAGFVPSPTNELTLLLLLKNAAAALADSA
jgi:GNAT superfamily N-acetyltransferase